MRRGRRLSFGRCATSRGGAALLVLLALGLLPARVTSQGPAGPTGSVEGIVLDSTVIAPLRGADVYLWGTSHRARTASDGTFRIADVPAGRHTVVFFHPRLAELGVSPGTTEVEVRAGEESHVRLAVPSGYTVLAAQCALEVPAGGAVPKGVPVVGRVTDGATGVPFPAARVRLSWPREGATPSGAIEVTTDEAGWFSACTAPPGVAVGVLADFMDRSSAREEVVLERGHPARLDLPMGVLRPAVLEGLLLDARTGMAVRGADVSLRGTELGAVTRGDGSFRVDGVPPGTYTLVVEHLPYAPREEALHLAGGRVTDVTVRLAEEAIAVPPIEVTVERTSLTDRAMGGFVVDRAKIEAVAPRVRDVADVLREQHVAGLIVRREGPGACVGFNSGQVRTHGRSGCVPVTVFIDGARTQDPYAVFTIPAEAIDRMILYRPIEAGNLFGAGSANGVLEVYTRW